MKKFLKKSIAVAAGALASSVLYAAPVNLDAASPVAIKYANETVITTNVTLRHGVAADQTATTAFGATLGTDVAAYVRVDLAGGVFAGTPTAAMFAVDDSAGPANVQLSQSGSTYVIFAVTPTDGDRLVATNAATFDTDTGGATGITVTSKNGVTLRYRLYETLTSAVNEGLSLKDTGAKSYATFTNALSATVTPQTSPISDVAAVPSYTAFTGGGSKSVAKVSVNVDIGVALTSGAAASAAGLLTDDSDVTVAGDFSLAKNDDAPLYEAAALSRVRLNSLADCSGSSINATTLTSSLATFTNVAAASLVADHFVCLTPEGTPEIPIASYTASIDYDPQAGFAVTDVSGAAAGSVTRNGVRMIAPLAQVPAGWLARLALTNTGTSDRVYSISAVTESGVTVQLTGDAAGGTIGANSTKVINLHTLMAVTGGSRASLVVTVNAPQSEIDGLMNVANATTGSASNYILSYKN